jgi:peroxiredoxin
MPLIPMGVEVRRYRWRRAGNRKFSVYKGWRLFGRAIVVVDKAGRVLYSAEVVSGGRLGRWLFG